MKQPNIPIFFIAADPLWALGLLTVYEYSFVITSGNIQPILDLGISEERCLQVPDPDGRLKSQRMLLRQPGVQSFMIEHSTDDVGVMLFRGYINVKELLSSLPISEQRTIINLNSPHQLVLDFEHKNNAFKQLKAHRVSVPHAEITTLNQMSYEQCLEKFGNPFVMQLPRGWAGHNTFLIESKMQYDSLYSSHHNRPVKIATFYDAQIFTVNTVISETDVHITYPFLQINDENNILSNNPMSSVGNKWSELSELCESPGLVESKIREEAEKVTSFMKRHDYVGFAGIDFIVDGENVYVQEINPRLTASVPFISMAENKHFGVSLIEEHIKAVLHDPLSNIDFWKPMQGSRIVGRMLSTDHVHRITSGIYSNDDLLQQSLDSFYTSKEQLALLVASRDLHTRKSGDELFQLFSLTVPYNDLYEKAKTLQQKI